jgi:hypothetical protein
LISGEIEANAFKILYRISTLVLRIASMGPFDALTEAEACA